MSDSPFDALNSRAAELRAAGEKVITLGQALPSFGPPASVMQAAMNALHAGGDVHIYSSDAGRLALRQALARRLRETASVDCSADDFIITAGGNQAFLLAVLTLVGPGEEVILPAPYFINHQMAIHAAGAIPVEVPLSEQTAFAVTWAQIEPFITSRTRAVVLCNPSNPTGAVIDPAEGQRVVDALRARDIVALSDETYMHFVYGRDHWSAASTTDWRQNVVMVNTFSKSFGMTGWRLGYLLADTRLCAEAIKIQDTMIICAPVIAQIAGERAVCDEWSYPLSYHQEFESRRRILMEGLSRIPRLHWSPTGGAFFAFVRVSNCTDAARLAADILEQIQVVVIPGGAFGRTGEGFLRISYGSAQAAELEEGLARLESFFQGYTPH